MRIGVNAISLVPDYDEEYVYLRKIVDTIRAVQPDASFVVFTDELTHDVFKSWERIYIGKVESGSPIGSQAHEKNLDRALKHADVDLVYSPIQTALDVPPEILVPFAIDLGFLSSNHSRWISSSIERDLKRTAARTPVVIATAESVRKQLLTLLGVPMNKVIVAQPGSDPAYEIPGRTIIDGPYLFTLCDTRRRDEVTLLRNAFERLVPEIPHAFVVLGRPDENEPDDWGPQVLRIHQCPVAQTAGLIQHSAAYICSSAHEGACLNVLDAMRAGARIVSPRVGGIEEIAGKSVVYFNHESVGALVSGVLRIIRESATDKTGNIEYARRRAAEFTWDRCAWRTLTAFKRVTPRNSS